MKKVLYSMMVVSAVALVSCGETKTENADANAESKSEVVEATTYMADVNATEVNWHGEVAGVYGHDGYVNLKSGKVTVEEDKITGGEFVVDMSAFYPTDSASYGEDEGSRITDLEGHLTQEDFFASAAYPTSKFVIKSVDGNTVIGDLTIRDKTHEETLEITSMEMGNNGMTMTGNLVFDRQKYDVAWVHYMKDMVLSDDIQISYNLVAKM